MLTARKTVWHKLHVMRTFVYVLDWHIVWFHQLQTLYCCFCIFSILLSIELNCICGQSMDTSIQDRHLWIRINPLISTQNLWIWKGNVISMATLVIGHEVWCQRSFLASVALAFCGIHFQAPLVLHAPGFQVFDWDFPIYAYFTHMAASSTEKWRKKFALAYYTVFNTNLQYSYASEVICYSNLTQYLGLLFCVNIIR